MTHPYCLSSFLTFRWVTREGLGWAPGVTPTWPTIEGGEQRVVSSPDEVEAALDALVDPEPNAGILLSSGIDSAIIGAWLPKGTKAYTIRFVADGAIDESIRARQYAERLGLDLKVVEVHWADYLTHADALMKAKRSPLHAIEVALFKAASQARADGVTSLYVGNGADSTFGGMDKLLAKDWTFDEFVARYTFVEPASVLREPVSTSEVWERYRTDEGEAGGFDVPSFLKVIHGLGIIQTFNNGIRTAGLGIHEPFEQLRYGQALDIARIRAGDTKYVLREVFRRRFPGLEVPEKIPFARPMDQWLADWAGPRRPEFRSDLDLAAFTGDQKWLIWCLERFLDLVDGGHFGAPDETDEAGT